MLNHIEFLYLKLPNVPLYLWNTDENEKKNVSINIRYDLYQDIELAKYSKILMSAICN